MSLHGSRAIHLFYYFYSLCSWRFEKKAGNGWLWCLRLVLFFSRMLYVYYVGSLVIGENLNTIQVSLHQS